MEEGDRDHTPRPLVAKKKDDRCEREDLTRGPDPLAEEIGKNNKKIEMAKKIKTKKSFPRKNSFTNFLNALYPWKEENIACTAMHRGLRLSAQFSGAGGAGGRAPRL